MEIFVKNAKGNLVATFSSLEKAKEYVDKKGDSELTITPNMDEERNLPPTEFQVYRQSDNELLGRFNTYIEAVYFAKEHFDGSTKFTFIGLNSNGFKVSQGTIGKSDIWWEDNKSRWFVRYPISLGLILVAYFFFEVDSTHAYKESAIHIFFWIGCFFLLGSAFFAYELLALGFGFFVIVQIIEGFQSMSVPQAVLIGALIIAFAIYKSSKK